MPTPDAEGHLHDDIDLVQAACLLESELAPPDLELVERCSGRVREGELLSAEDRDRLRALVR